MVKAAHQVLGSTLGLTDRTLPSPKATLMPPVWKVLARPALGSTGRRRGAQSVLG
jgi:hypothetical protein